MLLNRLLKEYLVKCLNMELSKKAINELRDVLIKEIGPKATSEMSDNELDEIGMFLLTVLAEGLKLKVREKENKKY